MLKHFLVLRPEGIPIFSFSNRLNDPHYQSYQDGTPQTIQTQVDNQADQQAKSVYATIADKSTLFSGLLSSFISFSKELGGKLQQIKLSNADLYTYENSNLIGVTITEPTDITEEIVNYKKFTEKMTDKFLEEYKFDLEKWNGNVSKFEGFKEKLFLSEFSEDELEPAKMCQACLLESCCDLDEIQKSS